MSPLFQPSYHHGFVVRKHYVDCLDDCIRCVVGGEGIQVRIYKDFSVVSGQDDHIWLAHTAVRYLAIRIHRYNVRPYRLY